MCETAAPLPSSGQCQRRHSRLYPYIKVGSIFLGPPFGAAKAGSRQHICMVLAAGTPAAALRNVVGANRFPR